MKYTISYISVFREGIAQHGDIGDQKSIIQRQGKVIFEIKILKKQIEILYFLWLFSPQEEEREGFLLSRLMRQVYNSITLQINSHSVHNSFK